MELPSALHGLGVLADLGYDEAELAVLAAEGVIVQS